MNIDAKGNIVAKAVWKWLHDRRSVQFVPWVISPDSKQYDELKAARQDERDKLLDSLEECIRNASKSSDL